MSLGLQAFGRASNITWAALALQATLIVSPSMANEASDRAAELFDSLSSADPTEQRDAVREIEEIGVDAVPPLIEATKSDNMERRHFAIELLGNIGEEAEAAVPDLIEALNDPEAQIRRNAAWALGRVGDSAQSAVPALLEQLNDEEWDVRADVIWSVGKVATEEQTEQAVDAIRSALGDESHHVRWSAAWATARIGTAAEEVLPDLMDMVDDHHWKIRASVASVVGRVASPDNLDQVLPGLEKLAEDENPLVRSRAESTLEALKKQNAPSF